MPASWNDDPAGSETAIRANAAQVLLTILQDAPHRSPPSVATAQTWHRELYAGVTLPVSYFAGEVRDTDPTFPELIGYEVRVGAERGAPSAQVPARLQAFETAMRAAVHGLDQAHRPGQPFDQPLLTAIVRLMAIAHGEWIRIHPFANGNGRTARLWANWVAARYGLPAFVRLLPRPASYLYGGAAMRSMQGDDLAMESLFFDLLRSYVGSRP